MNNPLYGMAKASDAEDNSNQSMSTVIIPSNV